MHNAGPSMVYKVIARKWRPQTFDEVIGQKHVTRTLKNAISDRRIHHAFLFTGERGVGKTSVARILAKCLNCHAGASPEPCGTCPSCVEITSGYSIDVHEIDGASNTGVDDIRTLRENIKYMPSRDRYKIYIIDEVHMLSTSAFNALLKTLEEPPEHAIFIFATTEPHKIPDTILSRCLRFDFKRIPAKEITEHLKAIAAKEHVSITPRGLYLVAREAEGSMRDAQTILERAVSYCRGDVDDSDLEELLGHVDRQIIYQIIECILAEDVQGCMDAVNDVYESGVDLKQFYYDVLESLRDVVMVKALDDTSRLVDLADEDVRRLESFASRISVDVLHRCFRVYFAAESEVVRSLFPQIALEICLLEMIYIKRAVPVDEIISRIDALTNRLGAPAGAGGVPAQSASRPQSTQAADPGEHSPSVPVSPGYDPAVRGGDDIAAFLAFVQKKHPLAASLLSHGTLTLAGDNAINMAFPEGSFFFEKVKEPETEKKLAALCREFFNRKIDLSIAASREKKNVPDRTEKKLHDKKNEDSALHNPIIQKVVETFNGRIVEIKTDQ